MNLRTLSARVTLDIQQEACDCERHKNAGGTTSAAETGSFMKPARAPDANAAKKAMPQARAKPWRRPRRK